MEEYEYEDLVSEAFRLRSTLPFSNDSAEDARIIIKHLFLNADREVCLYSDRLSPSVETDKGDLAVYDWVELYDAAEIFLQKAENAQLKIKVSEEEAACGKSKFLELKSKYPEQVHLTWGIGERGSNFSINDRGGFRLERGSEHQAVACANDREYSEALKKIFDEKLVAKANWVEASA